MNETGTDARFPQQKPLIKTGQQGERRSSSGLVLLPPKTSPVPGAQQVRLGLEKLAGRLETTATGLVVPATPLTVINKGTGEFRVATDEEVRQHLEKPVTTSKRSVSEIALAEFDLPLFLSREVRGRLENDPQASPYLNELIANIENLPNFRSARPTSDYKYSREASGRSTSKIGYYDRLQGQRLERVVSEPGPLEKATVVIAKLLQEPDFRGEVRDRIVVSLSELIKNYRMKTGAGFEIPEMPDLVHSIAESINDLSTRKKSRLQLYDLLGQIVISPRQAGEVVMVMDKLKDLEHPLAYQLTLAISEAEPSHPWIRTQQERRLELLAQLDGSDQDLFDKYDELMLSSRGLVFSGDILRPLEGKVGMEFEYGRKQDVSYDAKSPKGWTDGRDGENPEMRRSDQSLKYDASYRRSFTALSRWFADNTTHISSLHLHFDRQQHPHRPDLGGLYESVGQDQTLRENSLGTWEVRAMLPPILQRSLLPQRVADALELYLRIATEGEKNSSSKITTSHVDKTYPIDQLIFGYVAAHTVSPEGKLSLLMALHTPFMMQGINPLVLAASYDRESIPVILAVAKQAHLDRGTRNPFIKLLEIAYETNFGEGLLQLEQGAGELREQTFIRQIMEIEDPSEFAKELVENYFLTKLEEKLQTNQQLTKSDLSFLYGMDEASNPSIRNTRIEEICTQRNLQEDVAIILEYSRNQIAESTREIGSDTKVYIGPLESGIFDLVSKYSIKHIYTSFPEGKIPIEAIEIGGMSSQQLETEHIQAGIYITPYGIDMLKSPDFITLQNPQSLDTVGLKVQDLGLNDASTTDQVYTRAKELGLELVPAETGLHYRLKYRHRYEWLFMGMKQISDRYGDPNVLSLSHHGYDLVLTGSRAYPNDRWHLSSEFVFGLRKSDTQKLAA